MAVRSTTGDRKQSSSGHAATSERRYARAVPCSRRDALGTTGDAPRGAIRYGTPSVTGTGDGTRMANVACTGRPTLAGPGERADTRRWRDRGKLPCTRLTDLEFCR